MVNNSMSVPKRRCRRKAILLFLLSYLFFLLVTLPASLVLTQLPLPQSISLMNIRGTLWQGEIGELHWQDLSLRQVHWNILFSRLWLGMPSVAVSIHDPDTLVANADIGWRGSWQINELALSIPATALQQQLPYPLPAQVEGTLHLNIGQLRFDTAQCLALADAKAEWQSASLQTPAGELPLNSVHASLHCPRHDTLELNANQQSAALQSQLTLRLNSAGTYQLQTTLTPGGELSDDIRASLEWLGTKDDLGRIRIKNDGRWY